MVSLFRSGLLKSSSLLLALANLSELVLPLVRALFLARLLVPAQFGLAISVTIVAITLEMMSDLGIGQLALRQSGTDKLGTLHAVAALRGIGLALVIAALGPVFSFLFNAPGTSWVYSVVGLASVMRSFTHLENRIRMREYHYAPEALTLLGGQVVWTIVSIVAAFVLRDYRAMVLGVLSQTFASMIISHACATTRYRWAWDRALVTETFRFGRPLTMNGMVLAFVTMGDRMLAGSRLGLEQLAVYSALSTAAFLPRLLIAKFGTLLFLPQVINAEGERQKRNLADIWAVTISTIASLYAFAFIGGGRFAISLAFGPHYMIEQPLIDLAAVLICIRYMNAIPTMPSLAVGRTSFVFLNTVLATAGIGLAALLLLFVSNLYVLDVLLGALIVGEGLGLAWMLRRLREVSPATNTVLWTSYLTPIATVSLIGLFTVAYPGDLMLRLALCLVGASVDLVIKAVLLRQAGISVAELVRTLLPKRTVVLDQNSEASLNEILS